MRITKILLGVAILNIIPIIIVALSLPDTVPTHMNYNMIVDGWGSKWFIASLSLMPIIFAGFFMIFRYKLIKENKNIKNEKIENIVIPLVILLLIMVSWMTMLVAMQYDVPKGEKIAIPLDSIMIMPLSIFFIAFSNFMAKLKRNNWVGIRVPWTLRSETVWRKTHRLAGHLGVISGIIMFMLSIISLMTANPIFELIGLGIFLIIFVVVPTIYSAQIYQKEANPED